MPVDHLRNFVANNRAKFDSAEVPTSLWSSIESRLPATTFDPLESFILDNREDFDNEDPPAMLGRDLFDKLPSVQSGPTLAVSSARRRPLRWMRAAAAAVIFLVCGSLYLGRQMGYRAAQQQQLAAIQSVAPDFFETENYYKGEIEATFRQVSQFNEDPVLRADLKEIDAAMQEIREQLLVVPLEERAELITDLIKSYQLKLKILQRVLDALPKESNSNYLQNELKNELQKI